MGAVRVLRAHARRRGLQSRNLPGLREGVVHHSAGGRAMKAPHHRGRSSRPKILVIEDDPVARADLEARLEANGYIVARAAAAPSALTVCKRGRPGPHPPDLGT